MTAGNDPAGGAHHRDPLLRITKGLLYVIMAIAVIVAVATLAAIPALWLYPSHIVIDRVALPHGSYAAITGLLALVAGMAVLGTLFLRQIIAIIDSVKIGSPFVADNARRLRRAAWIVLAIEGLGFLAEPVSAWLKIAFRRHVDFDIDFSLGWLVTALLLFILARIFDQGTKLAEDVEGTV